MTCAFIVFSQFQLYNNCYVRSSNLRTEHFSLSVATRCILTHFNDTYFFSVYRMNEISFTWDKGENCNCVSYPSI